MSDDQDGCEWVSVSSGTSLPGFPGPKAVKRLCVCVCEYNSSGSGIQVIGYIYRGVNDLLLFC